MFGETWPLGRDVIVADNHSATAKRYFHTFEDCRYFSSDNWQRKPSNVLYRDTTHCPHCLHRLTEQAETPHV